jgi:pilus assembly protein CpaB
MSKRKLMLLLVAGLVAVGTVFVARALMGPPNQAETQVPVKTTQILAAARDLPTGSILREVDMKWMVWPADADNTKLYLQGRDDLASLVGAVVRDGMRSGDPIPQGRLVQPRDHGFLAAVLAPGKRAIAVTLTPSAEVAGFIFPGDHVDVILTHSFVIKSSEKNEQDTTERHLSKILVNDVRVLALDQKTDNQSTDPKVAQLATLEVTPRQAEQLALAIDMVGTGNNSRGGSISLVLRSLAAEDHPAPVANGTGLSLSPSPDDAVFDINAAPVMDSDVSPAYPNAVHLQKVDVMRGKETTQTTFQKLK